LTSDDNSNAVSDITSSAHEVKSDIAATQTFQFPTSETPLRDSKPPHLSYSAYYWTLSLEERDAYMREFKDLTELLIHMDNFLNYDEVSL